jgi:hypothetical protein
LKLDFKTISQKWSPYWDDMSRATFGSLLWRSRSQHDLAAKSCPAHKIVTWRWILQLFHRNDHHIKTTCRAQHLGRYVEGQGHSMTLQQNHVRPIFLLIEVWFYNYFTEMITISTGRGARSISVGFYYYFTEMITILRQRVACKLVVRSQWVEVQRKQQYLCLA